MSREEVINLLSKISYFSELDAAALKHISVATIQKKYETGQYTFMEGEPCIGLYIVKSGWLRAVKISASGREQVIRFVGPGEAFNEVGVLTGGVNIVSVEALEPSKVLIVQRKELLNLVDKHPCLAKSIIENLAHRVLYAMNLVTDLSLRSVESRLARFLIDEADGNTIHRKKWATQAAIAARIGTVPVVINRAFRAFVEDNLIELKREKILIIDYDKLQEIALSNE
ncbi:MAG: Crp/Fnr family transcriptional regulator [Anaerolineae bacterium]|jgi:CRP/FNR family transcriptional regulator|nr:Crp/Fnr family transcriptional regulator [Anaerolineae bacterium]MBT3711877.1 Crp/Fnr family transcriptional regulator [Anaerolineae bacterium]MBT4312156.1 Crp/Fnr family transcriptional regulator [Anaerolineae bacterium]MBT4459339.1 Crp/Fnr family transcriptional regulator [Anaerolineae bacterium]MBT4842787.1 Crp/Fnr family transcriptional regulator [Anaerolineae bacterium]